MDMKKESSPTPLSLSLSNSMKRTIISLSLSLSASFQWKELSSFDWRRKTKRNIGEAPLHFFLEKTIKDFCFLFLLIITMLLKLHDRKFSSTNTELKPLVIVFLICLFILIKLNVFNMTRQGQPSFHFFYLFFFFPKNNFKSHPQ